MSDDIVERIMQCTDKGLLEDWASIYSAATAEALTQLRAEVERLRADNESIRIAHSKDVDWTWTDDAIVEGWFVQPSVTNEQLRGWCDRLLAAVDEQPSLIESLRGATPVMIVAAEVRAEMEAQR